MKKVNSTVLVVTTLLAFVFTSCTSDDNLNSPKTLYLPNAAMYLDGDGLNVSIKFNYDSIGRLTKYLRIGKFSIDEYDFTYNENGLIDKVNYLSEKGYEQIYYDENDKISGIFSSTNNTTINYSYSREENSYVWSSDDGAENYKMYLNQNDDRLRSTAYADADYDYTSEKGVFADLQKQPYFNFFYLDDFVTQYMSHKALKSISFVGEKPIRCDYVLNELGYPVEVS